MMIFHFDSDGCLVAIVMPDPYLDETDFFEEMLDEIWNSAEDADYEVVNDSVTKQLSYHEFD